MLWTDKITFKSTDRSVMSLRSHFIWSEVLHLLYEWAALSLYDPLQWVLVSKLLWLLWVLLNCTSKGLTETLVIHKAKLLVLTLSVELNCLLVWNDVL